MRDGRAERQEVETYLNQYVETARGEPARVAVFKPRPGLSQRRMRSCSKSFMNNVGQESVRVIMMSDRFRDRSIADFPSAQMIN